MSEAKTLSPCSNGVGPPALTDSQADLGGSNMRRRLAVSFALALALAATLAAPAAAHPDASCPGQFQLGPAQTMSGVKARRDRDGDAVVCVRYQRDNVLVLEERV